MKKPPKNKPMMTTKNTTWKELGDHVASLLALQSNGKDINGMVADLQDYFMGSGTEHTVLAGHYLLHHSDFCSYFIVAYSATKWDEYLEWLFPERKEARQNMTRFSESQQELVEQNQENQRLKESYNNLQERHVGELEIMVRDYGKLQAENINFLEENKNLIAELKASAEKNLGLDTINRQQARIILELKAKLYDILDSASMIEPLEPGEGE